MEPDLVLRLSNDHYTHGRTLDALVRALASSPPDLGRAGDLLAEIDHDLSDHLRLEETELFPWLLTALPDQEDAIERLLSEHVQIMTHLTALRLALTGDAATRDPVPASAARFIAVFRNHTALEQAMVARARLDERQRV